MRAGGAPRALRRILFASALLTAGLTTVSARAQQEGWSGDIAEKVVARPHTIAELEGGVIILPTAPINGHPGGNTPLGTIGRGDATVLAGIHVLYRGGRDWALGAGALFAVHPTSDTQYGGSSGLPRTHSRNYLYLGGE